MPKSFAYADLVPQDPHAPFSNPTEEPDYSPDYCSIAPELETPQSHLPLFPAPAERSRIRRYFDLTLLSLLFAFLAAMTVSVAMELLSAMLLRQTDLRAVGELPENYSSITALFFADSSISAAIRLISVLCGYFAAFFIGSKLTALPLRDYFRTRSFGAGALLSYLFLGLWIRLLTEHFSSLLGTLTKQLGISLSSSGFSLSGSMHRTAILALSCCLIEPVAEELLLRGMILKNCCRVSQRVGILLSALLFAAMQEHLTDAIYALPLGILLAYITIRHNSVAPAIAVRIGVNTVIFLRALGAEYLSAGTFSTVSMVCSLGILAIGSVVFVLTVMTERLPVPTPHQSMRGWRIVCSAPMLWLFLLIRFGWLMLQNGVIRLPF